MVRYIKIVLCGLYNIWFYSLAATGIIICLPLFFIFSFKENWYPQFYWVARNIWAKLILLGMGLFPKVEFSEPLFYRQKCRKHAFSRLQVSIVRSRSAQGKELTGREAAIAFEIKRRVKVARKFN